MEKEEKIINLRGKNKKELLEAYKKIAAKSLETQEKIKQEKQNKTK